MPNAVPMVPCTSGNIWLDEEHLDKPELAESLSDHTYCKPAELCDSGVVLDSLQWNSNYKDVQRQTDPEILEALSMKEISDLKKEIKKLKEVKLSFEKVLQEANAFMDSAKKIFTEGQIRKMIVSGMMRSGAMVMERYIQCHLPSCVGSQGL
ncbi:uncharacterized protein [Eurosta solidaginis]|uniref:uncharacterized protein isoform X2 n=1 Tax=Eurosta solidaginis TaxID=178769 RepID=UPI003530C9D3